VILWLTLFLRVWQLDTLPPGLHYDEAFNGTMAREILRGTNRPIFFVDNFGEEPLHMYTEAVMFALIGESPWSIRITSALYGVLFVAAVYACARAFFPRADLLALVAAFLAATVLWSLMFDRIGIETTTLPSMLTLSAAALGFAYRRWSWRWVIGAGFLLGAMIYTYLASRMWLPAVFLWFLYLVTFHRAVVRQHFAKWVVIAAVALLTLAPLALFFAQNPLAFSGRSGTVFTPETFGMNVLRTAGMFFFTGDADPRDNLPGRAALDVILAVFFVIGLLGALARFRKPFYALLLIWLVVMCLPSALTEFAPNFRRAIGAQPATFLLCALGVEWVWARIGNAKCGVRNAKCGVRNAKCEMRKAALQYFAYALIGASLLVSAFWNGRAYFVDWASSSGLFYSFDAGLLQVAEKLAARPRDEQLCMSPNYAEHYTVRWALDGRPVSSFDGRRALVLPDSSRAVTCGIITHEDQQSLAQLQNAFAGTASDEQIFDAAGQPYATLLTFAPHTRRAITPQHPLAIRAGDFASLVGFDRTPPTPQRGDTIRVRLYWSAEQAAAKDYTVFVHLVGPLNPATHSPLWAQSDKQPGDGTHPTRQWQPGEMIIEEYEFKFPPEALRGEYKIQAGMYLLETGARVPLAENTQRLPEDTVTLDTFQLP